MSTGENPRHELRGVVKDDEVLRIAETAAKRLRLGVAGQLTADELLTAVAALQAERDALRADRDEQQRLYVKRIEAKHAAWEEAVSWRDMLAEQVQVAEGRAERAESALEALRGQVEGLVERWRAESNALPTLSHKGAGLDRGIKELSELPAIKERMG